MEEWCNALGAVLWHVYTFCVGWKSIAKAKVLEDEDIKKRFLRAGYLFWGANTMFVLAFVLAFASPQISGCLLALSFLLPTAGIAAYADATGKNVRKIN
ncbi:MAG: hypothetical protein K8L91_20040 [Anaerolineae bacterium]|nr:hypothetical protein [Anaerolineae bacterium]